MSPTLASITRFLEHMTSKERKGQEKKSCDSMSSKGSEILRNVLSKIISQVRSTTPETQLFGLQSQQQ